MEHHSPDLIRAYLDSFDQVPRYRLALPIRVSCQVDDLRLLGSRLELGDDLLFVCQRLVFRLEAVIDLDTDFASGQVTDVPHRRLGDVLVAKEPLDGTSLGRRFYNY